MRSVPMKNNVIIKNIVYTMFKKHYAVTSRIVLGFVIASTLKILP